MAWGLKPLRLPRAPGVYKGDSISIIGYTTLTRLSEVVTAVVTRVCAAASGCRAPGCSVALLPTSLTICISSTLHVVSLSLCVAHQHVSLRPPPRASEQGAPTCNDNTHTQQDEQTGKPDMSHEEQSQRPTYQGGSSTNKTMTMQLLYCFVFAPLCPLAPPLLYLWAIR